MSACSSEYRGATAAALAAYQRALAAVLAWRSGASEALAEARAQAPAFLMPLILQAHTLLCTRDVRRVRAAREVWQEAILLPANPREAAHLRAIASVLADDYDAARATLAGILRQDPHDVLALHVAHALDYLTGDIDNLAGRAAKLLPHWKHYMPGYHAVLSMQAFGLVESGDCDAAEEAALAALAANPDDARAHHVMAHVFEMSDRPAAGLRWMEAHRACWSERSTVVTHCWWHYAVFLIEAGRPAEALAVYDRWVREERSGAIADLIDASALLWRLALRGQEAGKRWIELAAAWAGHVDDAFCSFSDLHAMLAFAGAGDWASARRLEALLASRSGQPSRHGISTRLLGLPACRALIAFVRGEYNCAVSLLANLPALAHRLGGSHAQRDILHLTLLQAVERIRRPARATASRAGAAAGRAPAAICQTS